MSGYYWESPSSGITETQTYHCPYCEHKVAGTIHNLVKSCDSDDPILFGIIDRRVYCTVECPVCHKPSIYEYDRQSTIPFSKLLRPVNNLPEKIDAVYEEVRAGLGAGCYTSTVVLARTALMHIAVEQGAPKNLNFQKYVDFMAANGYMPPNAKEWVDKIRKMGNEAVHELKIWEKEDAELIGTFLMYLLIFVYELPLSIEAEER